MKDRFPLVNEIRGIASLCIVLFHAVVGNHLGIDFGAFGSALTVREANVIFFVISGFVIAHSVFGRQFSARGALVFMLGRSVRLDPPYWAAIVLVVGLSLLASALFPERLLPQYSAGQLFSHLFYLQDILGHQQLNPVFWTLSYEFQFYAVFALLLALGSIQLAAVAVALSILWPAGFFDPVQGVFVNLIYAFFLGAGAYYYGKIASIRPWFLAYLSVLLLVALVRSDMAALIAVVMAGVLLLCALGDRIRDGLNWHWAGRLGLVSYSLYLTHNPITGAVFRAWYLIAGRSIASQMVGLALAMAASVGFAYIFYLLVERPSINLARSVSKRHWQKQHKAPEDIAAGPLRSCSREPVSTPVNDQLVIHLATEEGKQC